MNRLYLVSLILLALLVIFPGVVMAHGIWLTTDKGCNVWDGAPQPNETATWSGGADENRYCTGNGILQWYQNGKPSDKYDGNMLNGKANGKGTYTCANGNRYEGDWVSDKRQGKGIYTYANGDRYEGDFVNYKFEGYGTYYSHDGKIKRGRWSNDQYIGP
jgi:hypothetical protein